MKKGATILLCTIAFAASAQDGVLINELQAANRHTHIAEDGSTPDWVELFNPTEQEIDIAGMRFAVVGRTHVLKGPLRIAPHAHRIIWFDGEPDLGPDHAGFTLPRKGGTLLLIAADGLTVQDVFTYPAMSGDLSVGRLTDGDREQWSFFTEATPGSPNAGLRPVHGRTATPFVDTTLALLDSRTILALNADQDAVIRYTTDGTEPTAEHGLRYDHPIEVDRDMVIRARAFVDGRLPSKEFCSTFHRGDAPAEGITIAMDGSLLSDDSVGINVEGVHANFSRRGRSWERLAMVKFNGSPDAPVPIGLSIHGSGSRSLPKRSFKLHARDRYDSPAQGLRLNEKELFQEGILRADAGAHTYLRNRFVELTILRNGLHVDVQPSRPMPLYLNGEYWGLYRWMPPKDRQWLERISDAGAVHVLEGPAARVLSGSDASFGPAIAHLMALAPIDTLERHIDVANLIDLACLDLWTGRADHDLNVRLYRPRVPEGRWRWVLFDMDLWAPYSENSVERMASGVGAETPYIPQLLAHKELEPMLLARMSALLSTVLSPVTGHALLDSLVAVDRGWLEADHARWNDEMPRPSPSESEQWMNEFIGQRPGYLSTYLGQATGRKVRRVSVQVPAEDEGSLTIEGMPLPSGTQEIICFQGITLHMEFTPAEGVELDGWKGADGNDTSITLEPERTKRVAPLLRRVVP